MKLGYGRPDPVGASYDGSGEPFVPLLCNDGGIGGNAQYIVCKLLFINDKHGVMGHKKSFG